MAADGAVRMSTMTPAEVGLAVDWAAAEGWNPGLRDAACFRAADPAGFLIGRIAGQPVVTISAVRYGDGFAFLGLYIVAPDHRERGIGTQAWNTALGTLRGRVVGLDGVVAMQGSYARSGFRLAHRNIRFGGSVTSRVADAAGVVDLGLADLDDVCAYDEPCFGAPRRRFLRAWIAQGSASAVGVRVDGGLSGYGVIRTCRTGSKIGPVFADSAAIARLILDALLSREATGETVFWDVPEPNAAACRMAEDLGMSPVFETARMYAGGDPAIAQDRVYGVTTFELG